MKTDIYIPERRPLVARGWNASHAAAKWLATLGVPPNAISMTGLLASLGAGAALAATAASDQVPLFVMTACLLILIRGMCNMLDGMVAVSTGKASRRGELFNEVPDRISDAATLVGAGYAIGGTPELGYVAALSAVFTAYVRVQGCSLGAQADFGGPMSKVHRMFVIVAAALFTAFAPGTWQPALGTMNIALAVVIAGCAVTSLRRLRLTARFLTETQL